MRGGEGEWGRCPRAILAPPSSQPPVAALPPPPPPRRPYFTLKDSVMDPSYDGPDMT